MMDDKALGLLGIARRAGRLSLGHDAAKGAVLAGRARLCLISAGCVRPAGTGIFPHDTG